MYTKNEPKTISHKFTQFLQGISIFIYVKLLNQININHICMSKVALLFLNKSEHITIPPPITLIVSGGGISHS